MAEQPEPNKPQPDLSPGPQTARDTDMLLVTYICYLIGVVFGITVVLGVVIAYLQRGEVADGWRASHYTWLIRTFWIGLLYGVVSAVLSPIGIGVVLGFATLVWYIIRVVKGWIRYGQEEPMANVESWFIG